MFPFFFYPRRCRQNRPSVKHVLEGGDRSGPEQDTRRFRPDARFRMHLHPAVGIKCGKPFPAGRISSGVLRFSMRRVVCCYSLSRPGGCFGFLSFRRTGRLFRVRRRCRLYGFFRPYRLFRFCLRRCSRFSRFFRILLASRLFLDSRPGRIIRSTGFFRRLLQRRNLFSRDDHFTADRAAKIS